MAMKDEQEMKDDAEFAAAFGADEQPTEDVPAGMDVEEAVEESAESPDVAVAVEATEVETPEMESAEMEQSPAEEAGEEHEEPMDEKELQRKRSWEGRLRAKEAELKAKEEAMKASHPVEKQDSAPEEEAVAEAVDKLEDGFDVDTVMKEMADDFGEDFASKLTKLIEHKAMQIAGKAVDEKVGSVSQRMDGMISNIRDIKVREHFEAIADKHPDFLELAESGVLKSYIDGLPENERAAAAEIVDGGTARQVIKLLDKIKEASKPAEPEPSTDAAEGVRSRGLKIPEKPTATSYEDAWDQF